MSLYLSLGEEDEDLSLDSFNGAQEIFSKEENRKDPAIISKSIRPLLAAKNPDDRWYAATLTLELEKKKPSMIASGPSRTTRSMQKE